MCEGVDKKALGLAHLLNFRKYELFFILQDFYVKADEFFTLSNLLGTVTNSAEQEKNTPMNVA